MNPHYGVETGRVGMAGRGWQIQGIVLISYYPTNMKSTVSIEKNVNLKNKYCKLFQTIKLVYDFICATTI